MSVRSCVVKAIAIAFAGAALVAFPTCRVEHAHHERLSLDPFELHAGEPRILRWHLCKEGLGTGEAINADLELRIEHILPTPGRVDLRRWSSTSAFEAGEDPLPFSPMDVDTSDDRIRIALRPEGPFTLDGRQCTGDQYIELEGESVRVELALEARVLDWGNVIDRLTVEAELLP